MKYSLIDEFFKTELFQKTVREYFDTVLASLIIHHNNTETKGKFEKNGVLKGDFYDMPYHIHILNGLIPVLHIYEKHLMDNHVLDNPKSVIYLKTLMLGFTFHDANKLIHAENEKGKTDLEVSICKLNTDIEKYNVKAFFNEIDEYRNEIYYLALSTENRTSVVANEYPIKLGKHLENKLRLLCHLADGLASIQELDSAEDVYTQIVKKLEKNKAEFGELPVSYVEMRSNPYTLLSQNVLQMARLVLAQNGKKVFYALRNGFIFFGENMSGIEKEAIFKRCSNRSDDLDPIGLSEINFQKCKFGFIGSIPFTTKILDKISVNLKDKFLAISPNNNEKIKDYDEFIYFIKSLLDTYEPAGSIINCENNAGKLYLKFSTKIEKDTDEDKFQQIYILHKICWLNTGNNKKWDKDFDDWVSKDLDLIKPLLLADRTLNNIKDIGTYLGDKTNSSSYLLKTLLNFIKTYHILFESDEDTEGYFEDLQKEIISFYEGDEKTGDSSGVQAFLNRYFYYKGLETLFFEQYNPQIPDKSTMCAFTGEYGEVPYTSEVAFGMKARGFTNRTVTNLNNTTSHISALYSEENKLRISNYSIGDANLAIYNDFFEASLDISRDIITAAVKAKNTELKFLEKNTIEFDKNAKFQYNLYNLDFIKLAPKVEPTFYFVRKSLMMVKKLGIRSYVTGIMSSYAPHKAVFHFENPPIYLKQLGWDIVRLVDLEDVLTEIRLILTLGSSRIEANLPKIALDRRAYFTIYYMMNEKDRRKVESTLTNFINQYKHKFKDMTIVEQLVELALEIDKTGYKSSGSQETYLIRTATDFLRMYVKRGDSREDIIQKISGELYRKMRLDDSGQYKMKAIEAFATAVYDDLYVQNWKKILPIPNMQKHSIYQFGFLFKKRSVEFWEEIKKKKAENTAQ